MGIFAKLLGSDNVISAGLRGIDALVYTDQEKSEMKAKFLKLYEPFKVAQRYISIICVVPYTSAWFITFIVSFFTDVSAQREVLETGNMGVIVAVIVSFYFAGGALSGGFGKK